MKFFAARVKLPSLINALSAVASAVLLTLAFPNFDLWFLAWFALVPLFYSIEREKESVIKSFILGWIFGTLFFAGSCWWLTFAFTHYGGIPTWLAGILLLIITSIVGVFPAMFAAAFSVILKRFGTYGILSAPFLWTAQEFLRASLADTSWNAIGYSQAFVPEMIVSASLGGIYLVGFLLVFFNCGFAWAISARKNKIQTNSKFISVLSAVVFPLIFVSLTNSSNKQTKSFDPTAYSTNVIVVQANVPMSGLDEQKWLNLRQKHVELAEGAIDSIKAKTIKAKLSLLSETETTQGEKDYMMEVAVKNFEKSSKLVIFPESPMNFNYGEDAELRRFIGDFARRHNASVLFNSAEPNPNADNYYNSAIMVNPQGAKIGQYDKIHLVPFGEFAPVPSPIKPLIPTLVGSFQLGENYNLFPVGEAQAGIMICYESHFPSLSREFVRRGADVLIEMTNDGYLGNTAVLRQHLAGAIFRAVETNRPVLRATNVGITAYINERGEVSDAADVYTEATRVWTISKSNGKQTFYVRYGDWFAWLCSIISLGLLIYSFWSKRKLVVDLHRQT